jgi:hypothetical protein
VPLTTSKSPPDLRVTFPIAPFTTTTNNNTINTNNNINNNNLPILLGRRAA